MLGLLLLYFLGKWYYKLAEEYGKHKWGFAILGVASYYIGTFIGGIAIVLFYELVLQESIDTVDDIVLSLMSLPFGILLCWGLHVFLKKQWSSKKTTENLDILDEDFMEIE